MDIEKWKRKRLTTFLVFTFQYFLASVEISISYTTSWLYMNQVVQNKDQLNIYYGLMHAVSYLPCLLFINVVAYLGDKYRRIKLIIIILNFITIIGSIVYLIPNSPMYLLLGRFLSGFNIAARPLITGEMARVYNPEELGTKIQLFRGIYTFGKAAGTLLVVLFLNTNFFVGSIHIRYANISSLIIFCLTCFAQFLVLLFVHDLSKELDLKEFSITENSLDSIKIKIINEKQTLFNQNSNSNVNGYLFEDSRDIAADDEDTNIATKPFKTKPVSSFSEDICLIEYNDTHNILSSSKSNDEEIESEQSPLQLLYKIITDIDIIFIMVSTFFGEMVIQVVVLTIPVVVIDKLNYTKETVNIIMAIQLVGFTTLVLILYFFKLSLVNNGILSWVITIAFTTCALIVSVKLTYDVNVFLLIMMLVFMDVAGLKQRVFLSVTLITLVQSKYQSFMESIRLQINFIGCLFAALLLSKFLEDFQVFHVTTLVIMVVFLFLTWYRRNTFRNLTVRI